MIWRLIYNETEILSLFETSDVTLTRNYIFEGITQEVCFDKIDELKITYYYPLNKNETLLFSGGTRTIIETPNNLLFL